MEATEMSINRGMDKEDTVCVCVCVCLCVMEYYTAIKKNEILHCCNMDEPRECQTEWSKSDREGEI